MSIFYNLIIPLRQAQGDTLKPLEILFQQSAIDSSKITARYAGENVGLTPHYVGRRCRADVRFACDILFPCLHAPVISASLALMPHRGRRGTRAPEILKTRAL